MNKNNKKNKSKDMTVGNQWSTILLFSLPIMGANLLQTLYNLADSVIVGNMIGANALGAVGLTGSMVWLLTAICTSVGSGVNIAESQFFGAKRETDIKEVIAVSYLIAVILSIVMTSLCLIFAKPAIFGFLAAPDEMREESLTYFIIYSFGIIFQLLYNITYGILRSHGNSGGALIFLLISAALNIVLDCIFIGVFKLGVAGAALATVIAQAGSAVASIIYLSIFFPELIPSRKYIYAFKAKGLLILKLTIPITLQLAVNSLGFIVLQRLINSFGTASIEGYSAMTKIEQLAHIPAQSLNIAISGFAGQNIGADKEDRAKSGYRTTLKMGILFSVIIGIIVIVLDKKLLGMFNISGESLKRGAEHLDILMTFIWVSTITNITCGFLQGVGDVRVPALSGFVNLGIRLVLSFMLSVTAVGYRCYFLSMPPAWIITAVFVVLRYRSGKWKKYRIVACS